MAARDGADLGYRVYAPRTGTPRASVVLLHGSASSGSNIPVTAIPDIDHAGMTTEPAASDAIASALEPLSRN